MNHQNTPMWITKDPAVQFLESIWADSTGHLWRVASISTGRNGDVAHLRNIIKSGRARNVPLMRLLVEYQQRQ